MLLITLSFHLVLINLFTLGINTVFCVLINQYSTGLFVSYSLKNPIAPKSVVPSVTAVIYGFS